jgi:hypothetical protein
MGASPTRPAPRGQRRQYTVRLEPGELWLVVCDEVAMAGDTMVG